MPDWKVNDSGDLVISAGVLETTANQSETAKQNMFFRLRSGYLDYEPEPDIAAGLDLFIGRQNTAVNGEAIKQAIITCFAKDGNFPQDSLYIEIVPLDFHTLGIYVFHQPRFSGTSEPVSITATYDLTTGVISQLDNTEL